MIVRLAGLSKFARDRLERVAWTAAEAAVSTVTVQSLGLPPAWIPVGAVVLAWIKTTTAKHVGKPDTASTARGV